jgi:hypothetical protein
MIAGVFLSAIIDKLLSDVRICKDFLAHEVLVWNLSCSCRNKLLLLNFPSKANDACLYSYIFFVLRGIDSAIRQDGDLFQEKIFHL